MITDNSPTSSPWRQPIVWLVVALVAAAVIGGVVMVRVAGQDGPMDAVPDDVARTGQVQQADLGPDAVAAVRKLSAIVRVDAKTRLVEVIPDTGEFERDRPLRVTLHQPLRAAYDVIIHIATTLGRVSWRECM